MYRSILLLLSLLFLAGCGEDGAERKIFPDGLSGSPSVSQAKDEVQVIELCPELPGAFAEILIRIDGLLYAYYQSGRLAFIGAGNYVTTDGRDCRFTVTSDHQVVY